MERSIDQEEPVPGGRICKVCFSSRMTKRAAELIALGLSDQAVADQLGLAGSAGRMVINRHRRNHIEAPARAMAEAASKGRKAVKEREQLVAAAEAGDPATFLALAEIVETLRQVQGRLERTADAAEADKQRLAVASLSGQQLRAAEVRAKLGGVGGYAAPRGEKSDAPPFVLTIKFSGGRMQRIEGMPMHPDDPAFDPYPVAPLSIGSSHPADVNNTSPDEAPDDDAMFDEDV
jgi:hypothetical protein